MTDTDRIREAADAWMTPFDGSGIEWHESLPSPYTYRASDFSKLVAAVYEYEARLEAAEAERNQYRVEADCGLRDFDALELRAGLLREALEKIAGGRTNERFDPWEQEVARDAVAAWERSQETQP